MTRNITTGILLTLSAVAVPAHHASAGSFSKDIRPMLSDRCFQCHGPDDKGRKGGLRLDGPEGALKGGKSGHAAIAPGDVSSSEMMRRILSTDPDEMMPPPAVKKPLTEEQKRKFAEWIKEGAKYEKHWAFTPPELPPVPGAGNEIDAFVRRSLEQEKLKPAAEAEPLTLFRRACMDLTGLPPSPEQVAEFLADKSPEAYAHAVERLLASPHYGEKWARRWLDLARYADTNGYEKDRARSIWPYRDWVIRSLNADMPFDQFTIEQIAGDLLPNPTTDQLIATGFHRNTMLNEEGGIDPLEYRYYAMVDRVMVTGAAWLGLTLQCAQCHTHKYDPVTQREYYSLMAFLNNADEPDLLLPAADAASAEKERAAKRDALLAKLPALWREKHQQPPGDLDAAVNAWTGEQRKHTAAWTFTAPSSFSSNLPVLEPQPDASVFVTGDSTKMDTYRLQFRQLPETVTAVRLEALPDPRLPGGGPGMTYYEGPKGDFFLGEFQLSAGGKPVKIASATESYAKNNFGGSASAALATDGNPETGWTCAGGQGRAHEAVFVLAEPLRPGAEPLDLTMMFGRHFSSSLGRFRISFTGAAGEWRASKLPPELQAGLSRADDPGIREQLTQQFLLGTPELAEARKQYDDLTKPASGLTTLVMRERPAAYPRPTHVHHRGEFTQPGEEVSPAVLSVLNPLPPGAPANRLSFARWLVSRGHPLTARVVVNRAWAAFFGRGLVKTQQDFGYQGEAPSHPELLDWLAVKFMEDGWSLKSLHRRIVMSGTYRQDSAERDDAALADPENKWLWRGPRRRLDAEEVRDSALLAAGILSPKMYGPGVYPPQPASVTTEGSYGALPWTASTGGDRYRRALYTYAKRTAPFAFTSTFDAPSGDACIVARDRSNTPLQALSLLNDVTILEAAAAFGKSLAAQNAAPADTLRRAFEHCFSRPPSADEAAALLEFYQRQLALLTASPERIAALAGKDSTPAAAAWALVCRTLFNLDEFVTRS